MDPDIEDTGNLIIKGQFYNYTFDFILLMDGGVVVEERVWSLWLM